MAYNESRVTVCGNVASGIAHSKVRTGCSRASFRLFTAERRWDGEQRAWVDGDQMFLSVTCWRALADNVHASLDKGDPVVVSGRMTIKEVEWEGTPRQVLDIEATSVGPNLALCTSITTRPRRTPEVAGARAAPEPERPEPAPVAAEAPALPGARRSGGVAAVREGEPALVRADDTARPKEVAEALF
ncbi:single-stranded DNA-binding protein [Saccharothrix longispora]|uniref:single-stranded DNA-binding protein n=1 Tax=Saccharothrix longispora TaxID=33920 RepID=UPI0028FD0D6D|nr:single-stranded DNA-binding protein [Saccharothrix longispora]MBY8849457.1 single-stranded DNA-binding protein [Saccharothrix sp. MB29]MDU0292382.1 single-stranded DNA-binding protein [Saccharothrix longispora]